MFTAMFMPATYIATDFTYVHTAKPCMHDNSPVFTLTKGRLLRRRGDVIICATILSLDRPLTFQLRQTNRITNTNDSWLM